MGHGKPCCLLDLKAAAVTLPIRHHCVDRLLLVDSVEKVGFTARLNSGTTIA